MFEAPSTDEIIDVSDPCEGSNAGPVRWDGVSFGDDGKPLGWAEMDVSTRDAVIDELTARARSAAAAVTRAEADLVSAVQALTPVAGWIGGGLGPWVAWQCGLTPAEASRTVALARKLPELPLLSEAFESGVVSAGTAWSMTRVATPENEHKLLDIAEVATGAQLQRLIADFRQIRPKPPTDPDDDPATRRSFLDRWWDAHGRLQGRFDLDPGDGALFEAALEAQQSDDAKTLHDQVEAGELRPEDCGRITSAEALAAVCEAAIASTADADGIVPEANQVIVHVHAETGAATLPGAGAVPPSVLSYLACQSLGFSIGFAGYRPVTQTTRNRLYSTTQRRALLARDQRCQYPGCGRHHRLHAHHSDEFNYSKITKLDAGVLLCPKHHRLVHRRGHTIVRDARGAVTVTRCDGTELVGRPPPLAPPPRAAPPPADVRLTGCHDRLTTDARDIILGHWSRTTEVGESTDAH